MTTTATLVGATRPLTRTEARGLAATENQRVLEQLRTLDATDWSKPTDCAAWDVRALVAEAGPRSARWRNRVPSPFRLIPMKQEVGGVEETWRMGYLLDIVLTRDTWMHRVDIARATDRDLALTPGHDGRIVADAVGEWARRLGRPFTLELTGAAGGTFAAGTDGENLTFDAIEFCRLLSGRDVSRGVLDTEVPF